MSSSQNGYRKLIFLIWTVFFLGLLSIPLFFFLVSKGLFGPLPSFEEIENPRTNLATEIFSSDEVLLGKYYVNNRTNITYDDLSPNIVNALISTEDERFLKHPGIDFQGTARAILFMGKRGGGSTITQQLASNLFTGRNKNIVERLKQKAKEYVIAIQLEKSYTKEEILAMYLNTVDFINQAVGIQSASSVYFSKDPKDLNPKEAALLVGMLQNPSYYNPLREAWFERTIKRRNVVLSQMKKKNHIDELAYDSLSTQDLGIKYNKVDHIEGLAPYFRQELAKYLRQWADDNVKVDGSKYNIYRDGLKVYTTLDSRMQKYAEEAVTEHLSRYQKIFEKQFSKEYDPWSEEEGLNILERSKRTHPSYKRLKDEGATKKEIDAFFDKKKEMTIFSWDGKIDTTMSRLDSIQYHRTFLQSGFMAMHPKSGHVKAWVGGIDFEFFKYDHANSDNRRQVGSTFKPVLYSLAIDNGWSPCYQITNTPVTIMTETGKPWTPKNAGNDDYQGYYSLKECLAKSVNTCAAYIIKEIRPQPVVDLAKKMGITAPIQPVYSLALGSAEVSLYEMMSVYSTFVNNGVRTKPLFITRIEDKNGNVIQNFPTEQSEALGEQTAAVMLKMLEGVTQYGTAAGLRSRYGITGAVAGKTGTTNNHTDGWFMGITPDLIAGTWVGCDDPYIRFEKLTYGQGGRMAMPIWAKFFDKVYRDKELNIKPRDRFDGPSRELDVEWDCTKYIDENIDETTTPENQYEEQGVDLDSEFE